MSETCNCSDGSSCQGCSSAHSSSMGQGEAHRIEKERLNPLSSVKKVIAVVSGKGGVGKSLISALLAVSINRAGKKTAIMDADITGPSVPKMFGLNSRIYEENSLLLPSSTKTGISAISINLLLEEETAPVIWRGPILAGIIKQFWAGALWENIDVMVVDMPPGTGDVPLTVFQSIPVDGIVIATSPQSLVSMVVEKAVNMASMMNIPVLGIVENMSYIECPDCGKKIEIFSSSKEDEAISKKHAIPLLASLPFVPSLARLCDEGKIEEFEGAWLEKAVKAILG